MARMLKGVPSGHGSQVLTSYDNPDAVPGWGNAFLSQNGNQISVTSAFGNIAFHREDAELVQEQLAVLADFIKRNVV
jgi:hypothetical protein